MYGTRRQRLAVAVAITIAAAACAPAGGPGGGVSLPNVKRAQFGAMALAASSRIAAGAEQPILDFTVEGTPPSVFVNYIVPDANAAAFETLINLPPGFTLTKVRILESDPIPAYWLSLNVYRVSGLTNGLRAEWSTYVDDGSGTPRFMIIRARASEGSLDPLGPLAGAEPFVHAVTGSTIATDMFKTQLVNGLPVVTSDHLFSSTIQLPAPIDRNFVTPTIQWVTANDYIYWLNGVNDRIFHNSSSHSAALIAVNPADVTISDDTVWAPLVNPLPAHVLVYLEKIQFLISPWWNITEVDGRVAPATLASLSGLKKSLYGGLTNVQAYQVLTGSAEPVVSSTTQASPPSASWHWQIAPGDLAAFAVAANLPPGLTLQPSLLQEGDSTAAQWLTLTMRRVTGSINGVRAEWSTTVNDGTALRTFLLEVRSSVPSLDPVGITSESAPYAAATPVSLSLAGPTVTASIGSGPTAFSSSFTVPPSPPSILAARSWIGAGDLRYWSNGVNDRVFYESSVLGPRSSITPGSVTVAPVGPWSPFADATPDRVWVDQAEADFATNPWWNVR